MGEKSRVGERGTEKGGKRRDGEGEGGWRVEIRRREGISLEKN